MQNFMETILSAVKTWTKGKIKDSTADWNQNDPKADNYVKNRTHWAEYGKAFYLNERSVNTNMTCTFYGCGDLYYTNVNQKLDIKLEIGKKYTIVFDGLEYQETLREVEDGMCFGFEAPYSPDGTGVPYGIWISRYGEDEGNIKHFSAYSSGAHTFAIYRYGDIVHKLDSKFLDLPTNLATTDYVQNAVNYVQNAVNYVQDVAISVRDAMITKMDKNNPTGTGSFSMNRKSGTIIGNQSAAFGCETIATQPQQFVSGKFNNGELYIVQGTPIIFDINYSNHYYYRETIPEIDQTSGLFNFNNCGYNSLDRIQQGSSKGYYFATSRTPKTVYYTEFVSAGENIWHSYEYVPVLSNYAHIVGNGRSDTERSNAYTLDFDGNAWFKGNVYVGADGQYDRNVDTLVKTTDFKNAVYSPKDELLLLDQSTKYIYRVYMKNGNLVSELAVDDHLKDFEYVAEDDGTYTLTGWKQTLNGQPSTECVIPDIHLINL